MDKFSDTKNFVSENKGFESQCIFQCVLSKNNTTEKKIIIIIKDVQERKTLKNVKDLTYEVRQEIFYIIIQYCCKKKNNP